MAGGTRPLIPNLSRSDIGKARPLLNIGSEIKAILFFRTISALKYLPPIILLEIHLVWLKNWKKKFKILFNKKVIIIWKITWMTHFSLHFLHNITFWAPCWSLSGFYIYLCDNIYGKNIWKLIVMEFDTSLLTLL